MSSGTGISWREDSNRPEVEPADHFEREMLDRIVEVTDALLPGAGEPPELREPEISFRFLDRRRPRAGRLLDGDVVHARLAADTELAAAFYRSLAFLVARRLNEDSGNAGGLLPAGERSG